MRKFRTSIGRMDFLFWITGGESHRVARPLLRLSEAVRTLCNVEGAIARAESLGVNGPGLKELRKRCRRDIRQHLIPKNQKSLSLKISKLIGSVESGQGLKLREKVTELRNELARWKRKDISANRELSRLTLCLERTRNLFDVHEKNTDIVRAHLKVLHKANELRTLRAAVPMDEKLKSKHEKSLQMVAGDLEATLQFARKKLKGF